jgi:large subunit ribosomal protein L2
MMAQVKLKKLKPTTPGSRGTVLVSFKQSKEKHAGRKALTIGRSKLHGAGTGSGRNNQGRITTRHKGAGHKRKFRIIDFKRNYDNVPAVVKSIDYDPNRTGFLALICYKDGKWAYILAPKELKIGDEVCSGINAPISVGNSMPLSAIPLGTTIHNIEMKTGAGAKLVRSAGSFAVLVGKDDGFAIIRLKSGEMRKIHLTCRATIGTVSNEFHNLVSIGKAGRERWMGIRPTVRGVAMNPIDHPHGGGEGRTSGGRHPVSPTGVPTKGKVTRDKNKHSSKLILRRRKSKRKG